MTKVLQDLFPENEGYYMDEKLRRNLDIIKKVVTTNDRDWRAISVALPGDGKTTFMLQILKYLDPKFNLDMVVFDIEEASKKFDEVNEKYRAMLIDESNDLASSQVGTKIAKDYTALDNMVRQKNWYVIYILPDYFSLSRNFAMFRSNLLIRIYTKKGKRGYFAVYGRDKKRMLYLRGKKSMNYHIVNPNFRGRFTKFMVVDEVEYRKRKVIALKEFRKKQLGTQAQLSKKSRDKAIIKLHEEEGRTPVQLATMFDVSADLVRKIIKGDR